MQSFSDLLESFVDDLSDLHHEAEKSEHLAESWQTLIDSMAPEHVKIIAEDLLRASEIRNAPPPKPGHPMPKAHLCHLSMICAEAVFFYAHYKENFPEKVMPLAMPESVALVYLIDEDAYPNVQCGACSYRYPSGHFATCPLCGGKPTGQDPS